MKQDGPNKQASGKNSSSCESAPQEAQSTPSAAKASPRFHDLDALRAAALLLGVFNHAMLFLIPQAEPIQHQVGPIELPDAPAMWYWISLNVSSGFRMPLYFLLSGFFTAMLWKRRGTLRLAKHRYSRIALPLLIGSFTIVPLSAWAEIGGAFDLRSWPFVWLDGVYHLWFLAVLLWLAACFFLLVWRGAGYTHPWLWWLTIPLTVSLQIMAEWVDFGPELLVRNFPTLVTLGYYTSFFFFGVFFYCRGFVTRRWWTIALVPALLLIFPAGYVLLNSSVEAAWALPLSKLLRVLYAWMMCWGLAGLFRWIATRERYWVRYISDSTYWVYLCHLPLIFLAERYLGPLTWSDHWKFMLICVGIVAVLLVSYQYGVRYSPIGTFLNGKRERPGRASASVGE
jgi:peptidoglycan/LPS O-acetylase OafA/YrhL